MSWVWALSFLVCFGVGGVVLRAAWHATINQVSVTGSLTGASGDHSGGATEQLGLWGLGAALFVGPILAFALFGQNSPASTPAPAAASAPASVPDADAATTEYRFTTDRDNIACVMRDGPDGESVYCDIETKRWITPAKPTGCTDTYAAFQLTNAGASVACIGGRVLRDRTVLTKGASAVVGEATCVSSGNSVECTLRGRGFRLSATAFDLF